MLLSVSIRDFVLISRLDLSPGNGFTALTGETGAGKSIILDAIALALGGPADRGVIRAGAEQASVAAEFEAGPGHPVWALLAGQGVAAEPGETLTLKRVIRAQGPARGFINDQPASAALLAEAGDLLVEIHGQHAASSLMRPSSHRRLLDQFAGNETLLTECAAAWGALEAARAARDALKAEQDAAREARDWLEASVSELERLAPQKGEAERLGEERMRLMQAERISEAVSEAEEALAKGGAEAALGKAARAAERICRLPGFESGEGALAEAARAAVEAIERALIEVKEAEGAVGRLSALPEASGDLDGVEGRLYALRAAGRKFGVEAELLPEKLAFMRGKLDLAEAGDGDLKQAEAAASAAQARWHGAAHRLSEARRAAAGRLEAAIGAELKPLKLGRAVIRVVMTPLSEGEVGANGAERIEFEAETNPGAGFGQLRKVASGGELARVSLALKCALAEAGSAGTLIFDEADQGVGGAVAAAIGERFEHLARTRQVFAVTHSPQVAAAADSHWLVEKGGQATERARDQKTGQKTGETSLSLLDASGRREEIARMLSGAEITDEARAAAGRLMEDA